MRAQVVAVTSRASLMAACTEVWLPLPSEATVNIGVKVVTSPIPVVTGSQLSAMAPAPTFCPKARNFAIV